ncbi:hypothetical protein [Psychrobacter frigidicola]|uniref:hypothetical protein n=1 Tax=Psychrobacter frigidicola TaxID=45611 RepID=UPI0019197EF2|nr:hypothetical protein [Psychrobacter frigidicola]
MTTLSHYQLTTGSCFAFLIMATGCQSLAATTPVTPNTQSSNRNNNQNNNSSTPAKPQTPQQSLTQQALHIQHALANKNYASIIDDTHPTRGVRFSMYSYVRPESDKTFSRAQFAQYLQESKIRFTWGKLDGIGDLLIIPLPKYLDTWVAGNKFNDARISINEFKSTGNMINNVEDIYQKSDVVNFYHKGSDEYAGMDWRMLRLVFDEYQGKRYLVAIINDQWTI